MTSLYGIVIIDDVAGTTRSTLLVDTDTEMQVFVSDLEDKLSNEHFKGSIAVDCLGEINYKPNRLTTIKIDNVSAQDGVQEVE